MARADKGRAERRQGAPARGAKGARKGTERARRRGDGTIPLGRPAADEADKDGADGAADAVPDADADADGDAAFADVDDSEGDFVFDADEENDVRPGERPSEERWYEVVERKLANLPRPEGHDRRTWDGVFDRRTMMTLYKLISNEMIETLDFPISTGKEADVFRATTPEDTYVCIKIFRTNTATFHDVLQYIQGDPRFKGIKPEKHGLVQAWAQKEYRNLGRSIDAGVRVPEPIACLDNVLVMAYIGTEEGPYAILKDVEVPDPEAVAEDILDNYHRMLVKGRLVHADISEYNVLWADTEPVIIDVGQAVLVEHPMSREFFDRDVRNMSRFLTKMGAPRSLLEVQRHVLGDIESFEELI